MGGCYDTRAVGSRVCREARDGACVRHAEENKTDKTSAKVGAASTEDTCPKVDNDSSQETGKCKSTKCDVTIGGNSYCSQCSLGTDHLVDGKCVAADTDTANACTAKTRAADGTCASCAKGYFLHRGGCYQIGQAPGNAICTDTQASSTVGECTACAAGYFKNPTQAANKPPCIACNDTTGDNTNKGKAGCATCKPPESSGVAKCTACLGGFFGTGSDDLTCTACTNPCKTCKGANNKCTSCNEGNTPYFKEGTNGDGTGTCVAEGDCKTGSTHFPTTTTDGKKLCTFCSDAANGGIANCQECSKSEETVTCSACNNGKKPNTTGAACVACNIANCASCDKENVCAACTNKKLSPLKDACLTDCPAGTYDDNSICKPCHVSCAECNNNAEATSCTACYPGRVLNKGETGSTGTCIPECTGRYAENCEAGMCTAVLGGSKYCSKCKSGFVPVDGLCVSATTRAPTGCTPKGDGTCSACTDKYFLESGGCYKAGAFPGNAICTTAQSGACQTCTTTGQAPNSGV
ncbi:Variant-specific surface protein [Giardia duodenalis]|uniref:Variant-specific surface protein n=1 Tax=Giardia intestinalis TaxID=5741 RepID=V6TMJ3_GIAIN|nr:Variant-specific surface protein [Giardia intestinalis]